MPSLAAAVLLGSCALAAVVPGAEGPRPRSPAAATSAQAVEWARGHARPAGWRLVVPKDADHVPSLVRPEVRRDRVLPFLAD